MLEYMLLAAAQVQTIRLPTTPPVPSPTAPAQPPQAPAPIQVSPQPGPDEVSVALLPDLVLKEVRTEGDTAMHFLVANEGTADSTSRIDIYANIFIDGGKVIRYLSQVVTVPLGESRWVTTSFGSSLKLDNVTSVTATVDPPSFWDGSMWGGDKLSTGLGSSETTSTGRPQKCDVARGCIRETNEMNNQLAVEASAITRGKPD